MKIRPGWCLLGCLAVATALGCLAFAWPAAGWLVPAPLAMGTVLAVVDYCLLRRVWTGVTARRELPVCVARGAAFEVSLHLRNDNSRTFFGVLRDMLPPEAEPNPWLAPARFGPRSETTLRYRVKIETRGLFGFGPLWLRLAGPWGALEGQRRLDCPGQVKVLPETLVNRESLEQDISAERILLDRLTRSRLQGTGTEFESMSEFQPGDDPRRVDWRTSARMRQLFVRRFLVERHRDLFIVLDCGRLMGTDAGQGCKLDRAVDSALMLARVALESGDRCGLALFDDQVRGYLPPVSGPDALRTITECLYRIQPSWDESNFNVMFATLQARQTRRALVVVLSDLTGLATSERFRTALKMLARRHVVIFAALQTGLLGELVMAPLDEPIDLPRKAVALRVLRERERALVTLRRAGIHILDVEPRQLTVPLINRYLQLRRANLV